VGFAVPAGVGQDEAPVGPMPDDDDGVDEAARFATSLALRDPEIPGCLDPAVSTLGPPSALLQDASHPPTDEFFIDAPFLGAVRDVSDTWANAPWTRWD
jgi:hypothetical protein